MNRISKIPPGRWNMQGVSRRVASVAISVGHQDGNVTGEHGCTGQALRSVGVVMRVDQACPAGIVRDYQMLMKPGQRSKGGEELKQDYFCREDF